MKKNNPVIPRLGVCDPHIHIFNNRAYLYASHDRSEQNKTWLMDDWQIWSSADLVHWQYESTFRPEDTYIGPCERCWAVDAAEKNGKYYYYFSNGDVDTGAAVSDRPGGPFRDALGKPLLPQDITPSLQYDPTVFVDDDGTPYLIWGCIRGDGYYIARLNENMISLAETPRQIRVDDRYARDDKSFLHKKNGIYYLSCGSFYATSDNVYGPYHARGTLGVSEDHGSFFSWNGQDFYAYTIFDPGYFYRGTGICYIHYRANGEMEADPLIAEYGVGTYDADWNKIYAAWYMRGENAVKRENVWGHFDMAEITDQCVLHYPNVQGVGGKKMLHFFGAALRDGVEIEVWDDRRGKQIGCCKVYKTGSYDIFGYRMFCCDLTRDTDDDCMDLRLTFRGCEDGADAFRLYWFKFT